MPNTYIIIISHESREIGDAWTDKEVIRTEDYDNAVKLAKQTANDIADVYGRSYVTIEDEDGEVIEEVEGVY